MKTDSPDGKSPSHAPPSALPATSRLRLTILLGVLILVAGALLFDRVIAPPRVVAANKKLHETVLQHNARGLKTSVAKTGEKVASATAGEVGGLLYSEDIQQILGMVPSRVETTEFYTIEHYSWWGWIPRNTNFITVVYVGDPKRRHYSTHYANEMPEDESLPGKRKYDQTPLDLSAKPGVATAGFSAGPPMSMMPGPMGAPGAGGGKGKGRPQGTGDKTASDPKASDEGAKKVDESQKNDESSKGDEPAKTEAAAKESGDSGEKKVPAKETADETK